MSMDTVGMSSTHWQYSATIFNKSNTVLVRGKQAEITEWMAYKQMLLDTS